MAEHIKQAESPINELKMNFSCQICSEQYTKNQRFPITLNCGHTFCVNCIKRLCQNRRTIQCGNCRKNTYSDYRKLGKNIVLLELLEFNDLIGNDENNESILGRLEEEEQQQWEGTNQFIGRSEFEEFYTNLNDTEILVAEMPYSNKKSRMKRQINKARDDIKNVENQLNTAGDAYRLVMNEVRALGDEVNYEIGQLQIDRNNEPYGRISPDILIHRPPSDDSEEEDGTSYQRPTTSNFRRNRRRHNIRCGPVQFEFHCTNWREEMLWAQQNAPPDNGDWGGSSDGWGSDREERMETAMMDVQPAEENQIHEEEPPPAEMQQIPITQEESLQQEPDEDDDWWGGSSDGWGSNNEEEDEQPEEYQIRVEEPNEQIPTTETEESQNVQPDDEENDDWDQQSSNGWGSVKGEDEQPKENPILREVMPPVEVYVDRTKPPKQWVLK